MVKLDNLIGDSAIIEYAAPNIKFEGDIIAGVPDPFIASSSAVTVPPAVMCVSTDIDAAITVPLELISPDAVIWPLAFILAEVDMLSPAII